MEVLRLWKRMDGGRMKELILANPNIKEQFADNPWSKKFVEYFLEKQGDVLNINRIKKELSISPEERFESGIARYVCAKKIELGIMEDNIVPSYQHSLYIAKRLQTNIPKQGEVLIAYLLTIPTDEGVAFVKILNEKRNAFSKDIHEIGGGIMSEEEEKVEEVKEEVPEEPVAEAPVEEAVAEEAPAEREATPEEKAEEEPAETEEPVAEEPAPVEEEKKEE